MSLYTLKNNPNLVVYQHFNYKEIEDIEIMHESEYSLLKPYGVKYS